MGRCNHVVKPRRRADLRLTGRPRKEYDGKAFGKCKCCGCQRGKASNGVGRHANAQTAELCLRAGCVGGMKLVRPRSNVETQIEGSQQRGSVIPAHAVEATHAGGFEDVGDGAPERAETRSECAAKGLSDLGVRVFGFGIQDETPRASKARRRDNGEYGEDAEGRFRAKSLIYFPVRKRREGRRGILCACSQGRRGLGRWRRLGGTSPRRTCGGTGLRRGPRACGAAIRRLRRLPAC